MTREKPYRPPQIGIGGRLTIQKWIRTFPIGSIITMDEAEDYMSGLGYNRKSVNGFVTGLKIMDFVERCGPRLIKVISHREDLRR